MNTPTVLVTGGAGFIGSALVRLLMRETQNRVVNYDKLTYAGNLESLPGIEPDSRYAFVQADIADPEAVSDALERYRPGSILHLAAESHVDRSIDGPRTFIATNIVGTFTLLDQATAYWRTLDDHARERFRFLHVSTDEVFGSLDDGGRFTEQSPYSPNSPYAASKAAADHLARAWFHTYGLPVIVTNTSNNYGPYQFPEKLIPLIIMRAERGEELPVYGRGENVRDWLYVDDHARGLLCAAERGVVGDTYAFGAECERKNIDVVRKICELLDELAPNASIGPREKLIRWVTDRPGHDFRYAIDPTKAKQTLGWTARESFASGLRRTVEWYLENTAWRERVISGAYRGERLGLAVHS
jgi:dTDP-glucose 4,6-dehydratase